MKIKSDEQANPALQAEMQDLRSSMSAAAETEEMPLRFAAIPDATRPGYNFYDSESGRTVFVPLFAYREVRAVLSALFS